MAKSGVNKVILVANLGQDPEVRTSNDGNTITTMSVATGESWTDKQGNKIDKTEWHRVVVFGKLAEIAAQYLAKGSKVFLEGKLQTRKWQDQQGQDRYTTEIVVDSFDGTLQMLDSRNGQQQGQYQNRQGGQQQYQNNRQQQQGNFDNYNNLPPF